MLSKTSLMFKNSGELKLKLYIKRTRLSSSTFSIRALVVDPFGYWLCTRSRFGAFKFLKENLGWTLYGRTAVCSADVFFCYNDRYDLFCQPTPDHRFSNYQFLFFFLMFSSPSIWTKKRTGQSNWAQSCLSTNLK